MMAWRVQQVYLTDRQGARVQQVYLTDRGATGRTSTVIHSTKLYHQTSGGFRCHCPSTSHLLKHQGDSDAFVIVCLICLIIILDNFKHVFNEI